MDYEQFAIAVGAFRERLSGLHPHDAHLHVEATQQFCATARALGRPVELVREIVQIAAGRLVPTDAVRALMVAAVDEHYAAPS